MIGALAVVGVRYLMLSRRRAKDARGAPARGAARPRRGGHRGGADRARVGACRSGSRSSAWATSAARPRPRRVMRHRVARGGPRGRDPRRERGHRRSWHVGRAARRPGPAPRPGRAGHRDGRARPPVRRAPTSTASTCVLAMDRAERGRPARAGARRRRRAPRCACCASSTPTPRRRRPRRCPTPTTAAPRASPTCFDMVDAACAGLLAHLRDGTHRPGVSAAPDVLSALAAATGDAVVGGRRRWAAGASTGRCGVTLADGRRVFVKHHPDAPPGIVPRRGGRPGLARGGRRAAHARGGRGGRGAAARGSWRWSGSSAAGAAPGADEALRARPGGPAPRRRRRASAWTRQRHRRPAAGQRARAATGPTFYARRRLAPMARRAVAAGEPDRRLPGPARAPGRPPAGALRAAGAPGRACTATCGAATRSSTPAAAPRWSTRRSTAATARWTWR